MSGICGSIAFNPSAPVDGIDAMIGAAPWRGPDGVGVWRGDGAVLAHQALHVTPESRHEEQPLVDEEAGLVLVADARIDNRDELQRTLRRDLRRSVRRNVITDADLILAAYRRWGTECAAHLLGDFAFAVWDRRKRQLFAAHDPMAMRPFYYRIEEGRVLFGSEVKQILAAPGVPREIFEPMVAMHLCGRFDRLDWTFYEGIAQLEPAHVLVVMADGNYRTWRYWDIDPTHQIRYENEQDYVAHFRELFKEAVRCRLRSHKPVGLFLSGGLDSGSIASMAGHLKETEGLLCPDFRTYSWKFPTLTQCDERHISDLICERYDLPATYIDAEAVNLIGSPDGVPDADEPFMGVYQALLTEGLRQARAEGVGVIMSGHRGDLLVGNWIFDYLHLLKTGRWVQLARALRAHEAKLNVPARRAATLYLAQPLRAALRLKERLPGLYALLRRGGQRDAADWPPWVGSKVRAQDKALPAPHGADKKHRGWARQERYAAIQNAMHMRTTTWFNRMATSQHAAFADPWADRRLVAFVMAIPPRQVCQAGENKHILKEAMRGIMPPPVLQKSGKVDPSPLYQRALRSADILQVGSTFGLSHSHSDVIDVPRLRQEISKETGADYRIWYALSLLLWNRATATNLYRLYDENPTETPLPPPHADC